MASVAKHTAMQKRTEHIMDLLWHLKIGQRPRCHVLDQHRGICTCSIISNLVVRIHSVSVHTREIRQRMAGADNQIPLFQSLNTPSWAGSTSS